ncbi:hypothetical protein [Nostoc sp.]|uniref:hypothetical protein n=1 Tax=Nostoc sp. TaxID=1180 RepID=UPI002FF4CA8E
MEWDNLFLGNPLRYWENNLLPNAQCPMPNAQYPMPNAQCQMPNAQCPMPNAQYLNI